jgi:hypothetical protein
LLRFVVALAVAVMLELMSSNLTILFCGATEVIAPSDGYLALPTTITLSCEVVFDNVNVFRHIGYSSHFIVSQKVRRYNCTTTSEIVAEYLFIYPQILGVGYDYATGTILASPTTTVGYGPAIREGVISSHASETRFEKFTGPINFATIRLGKLQPILNSAERQERPLLRPPLLVILPFPSPTSWQKYPRVVCILGSLCR